MSAGMLRDRINFLTPAEVPQGARTRAKAPDVFGGARSASIRARKPGEVSEGGQMSDRSVYDIRVRFERALQAADTSWEIRDARTGDVYEVLSVDNFQRRNRWLDFVCRFTRKEVI